MDRPSAPPERHSFTHARTERDGQLQQAASNASISLERAGLARFALARAPEAMVVGDGGLVDPYSGLAARTTGLANLQNYVNRFHLHEEILKKLDTQV